MKMQELARRQLSMLAGRTIDEIAGFLAPGACVAAEHSEGDALCAHCKAYFDNRKKLHELQATAVRELLRLGRGPGTTPGPAYPEYHCTDCGENTARPLDIHRAYCKARNKG